ncbi:tyrosine-type recombinase/integrase [Streptomyces sp. NPDC002133]|uniref:tyrosine-type recombinase/integrase n=1 Tax=Streptomyces sp. NPDC002133 TaxID=3154409 RepID=UPI0033279C17
MPSSAARAAGRCAPCPGLAWPQVGLTGSWFRISAQIVEIAYRQYDEAPKQNSVRTVTLDSQTRELWQQWRLRQDRERQQWSGEKAWVETNRVWTHEYGEPLHPDWMSRRLKRLVELSGLPPIRLHDTRHLSATLALLGKADIKVVQERWGTAPARSARTCTQVSASTHDGRGGVDERSRAAPPKGTPRTGRAPVEGPGKRPGGRRRWSGRGNAPRRVTRVLNLSSRS